MEKGEMINAVIGLAKVQADIANKEIDGGDLFFRLAFMTDKQLYKLCKKLGIVK